ncbi:MAG TPA: TonB-dependent receptor [Terriglobia bacterium]|nr:TonB-dependent receptor [Terriglobia bacterium]
MKAISVVAAIIIGLATVSVGFSQSASTGALTGTTTDATRAVIPGVEIQLKNEGTSEVRTTLSGENGAYSFLQLTPGVYRLEGALPGFKTAVRSGIRISVTETSRLDIQLEIGSLSETISVEAAPLMVQQETSALGRVVGEGVVSSLPLVTRNFTQIMALSPGITTDVTNAGELGRGSGGQVTQRTSVNGSRSYDRNFQLDGVDTNDLESSDAGLTPGAPVPNPDAIQEFKVQTSQADAAFGRTAGAAVNIITKSGSNELHGAAFEFLRNEALNANDYFFNLAGQKKPIVRQNQYGGTLGGPIKHDKLFFFGSFQGTRQLNGLAAGKVKAVCNTSISGPPLTDDRSAAALGRLFAGQRGQNGGVAILEDGSNINPIALRVLNLRLPKETVGDYVTDISHLGGGYLFPTPQVIDRSLPFAQQGFSTFSDPCRFSEDQYMTNFDFLQTDKSKFSFKTFVASSNAQVSFQQNPSVPGNPFNLPVNFAVISLNHGYVFSPQIFNELRGGYYLDRLVQESAAPFKYSDVGINAPFMHNARPAITITGSYATIKGTTSFFPQRVFDLEDHLSYVRGRHNFRFGAGGQRRQSEINNQNGAASMTFQSFPDFLLGQSAAQNGSQVSNIFSSSYAVSTLEVGMRVWDAFAYAQDDWKVSPRLTLNVGLRFDRIGHASDYMGDDTNFDLNRANPNPPPEGTLAGHIVANNYNFSTSNYVLPAGLTRLDRKDNLVFNGTGQNNIEPRFGFALQLLPNSSRLLLRGGYGWYYSAPIGLHYFWLGSSNRPTLTAQGTANAAATLANPFAPLPPSFQDPSKPQRSNFVFSLTPYSPTTNGRVDALEMNFRHPLVQQYSLNVQTEVVKDFLVEVGYVGSRSTHLTSGTSANQASLASPSNPIRGVTTNTVSNVPQRVRIQGFQAVGINYLDSSGIAWYNSLQTSVTKRMTRGLQFLMSYTWSKSLSTDAGKEYRGVRGGTQPGDQNNRKQRYGESELGRRQRLVFSYVYNLPKISGDETVAGRILNGWSASGVVAVQTGSPLSILYTNANNVYGITDDRGQMAAGCTANDLYTTGPIQARLKGYFNKGCLTTPPVIGDDGRATDFGNTAVGLVHGPGQYNTDLSLTKKIPLGSGETRRIEFRTEFFNLFNTPQFSNPEMNFSSSNFGRITSTSVNPRFLQFALKLVF